MTPELTKRLLSGFMDVVRSTLGGRDPEPEEVDLTATDPRHSIYLAAFGKHPGWDDHVDDMGLETPLLVWVKRLLYLGGIAGNIDSEEWERLPAADRLEKFDHGFIWKAGNALVLGRLWSSTDGKGRGRYPMVIAAQCTGLPAAWVLANVPRRLEEVRAGCVATRDAGAVRALIDRTRDELRAAAEAAKANRAPAQAPTADGIADVVECLASSQEMGADHKGLLSVLYEVEYEMSAFRPGGGQGKKTTITRLTRHLRVPACTPEPYEAMHQWVQFLGMQLDPAAPVLAIHPMGQGWVDLTVGEPGVRELFPVRASRKKVPYATDIPYKLTPAFVRRAEAFIARHRKGAT